MDTVVFNGPPIIEQKLWPTHCVQKTWGSELHPDLKVSSRSNCSVFCRLCRSVKIQFMSIRGPTRTLTVIRLSGIIKRLVQGQSMCLNIIISKTLFI